MIAELTDAPDRVRAVDFAQVVMFPDKPAEHRARAAASFADLRCPTFAVDSRDEYAEPEDRHDPAATLPIYAVQDAGEIKGVAVCSIKTPTLPLRLLWLAVDPSHRGQGIGAALARHVVQSAPIVHISTDEWSLVDFYDPLGWRYWQEMGPAFSPWLVGSTAERNPTLRFGRPHIEMVEAVR